MRTKRTKREDAHTGARGVVLRGAGHAVTAQCADEVNALLLEHFAEVDRPALQSAASG